MFQPVHLFTLMALSTQHNVYSLELYHCEFLCQKGLAVNHNGRYKVTPLGLTTIQECMRVCSSQPPVSSGYGK